MRDLGWTAREARTFMRHQYEAHYEPLRSILQVKVSAGRVALPSCWTAPSLSDADNTLLAQSAAIVAAKLATIPNDLLEITLGSYLGAAPLDSAFRDSHNYRGNRARGGRRGYGLRVCKDVLSVKRQ